MSDFEHQLEVMDPDKIRGMVKNWAEKYPFSEAKAYSEDEIAEQFEYLQSLVFLGELEPAAAVLQGMQAGVEQFLAAAEGEAIEAGLDFLVEWHMTALRFTPESREDFGDFEHYRVLLNAFESAPPKFRAAEVRVKLQILHHYNHWLARGGDLEKLPEDDYEFLATLNGQYEDELEEKFAGLEAEEDWKTLLACKKPLAKYYIYRGKNNSAVQTYKSLIELTRKTDGSDADVADLEMELGKLFAHHKKWKTAKKYFSLAREHYGDEESMELFAMQAEGWLSECNQRLA